MAVIWWRRVGGGVGMCEMNITRRVTRGSHRRGRVVLLLRLHLAPHTCTSYSCWCNAKHNIAFLNIFNGASHIGTNVLSNQRECVLPTSELLMRKEIEGTMKEIYF